MKKENIKLNIAVRGSILSEPIKSIANILMRYIIKPTGRELNTRKAYDLVLDEEKIAEVKASSQKETFSIDSSKFHNGIESLRLEIACKYYLYFFLLVSRANSLSHQLEIAYSCFCLYHEYTPP